MSSESANRASIPMCAALFTHLQSGEIVVMLQSDACPDPRVGCTQADIDAVMEAQKDLVDIVHTLRQVVCVKG